MIRTADDVIDALGGTAVVAELLGVAKSTVSSWRARAGIPAENWRAIVGKATELGRADLTLDVLAAMHAKRPDVAEARP